MIKYILLLRNGDLYALDYSAVSGKELPVGWRWITTKTGVHVLLDADGKIVSGMSDKYKGKTFSEIAAERTAERVASGRFPRNAYKRERINAAIERSKSEEGMDKILRPLASRCWLNASTSERNDIYEYTGGEYEIDNGVCRRVADDQILYSCGRYFDQLNQYLSDDIKSAITKINNITNYINGSSCDTDVYLYRGIDLSGAAKLFGDRLTEEDLENLPIKDIRKELIGKEITEHGFSSCGSSAGKGFDSEVNLEIYAPAGTKMAYLEPFSCFGGDDKNWDGHSSTGEIGSEQEALLQRGTKFKIKKIKRNRVKCVDYEGNSYYDVKYTIQLYVVGCDPRKLDIEE